MMPENVARSVLQIVLLLIEIASSKLQGMVFSLHTMAHLLSILCELIIKKYQLSILCFLL